jgi:tRNA(fMet)-specific endonuclease VapC
VKFLFDTDHISILQRRSGPEWNRLSARMAMHSQADLAFSIVSFHEQALGCHTFLARARTTQELIRGYEILDGILQSFLVARVLPFDAPAAGVYSNLRSQRLRAGSMDLRIASIALTNGLTVLTRNRRDFGRVPGLVIDDWTA